MLNETKDKNNCNFNHEAQVKLLCIEQIFKLKIDKFMHEFYNNQLSKMLKNTLLILNKYTSIQLDYHATMTTSHYNIA